MVEFRHNRLPCWISLLCLCVMTGSLAAQRTGGGAGTGGGTGIGGGAGIGGGGTGAQGGGAGFTGGAGMLGGTGARAGGGLGMAGGTTGGTGGAAGTTGIPSSTNFLATTYRYPYVTALGDVDTGAQRRADRTQGLQSMVNNSVAAFGGPTFGNTAQTTGAVARTTATTGTGTAAARGGARQGALNQQGGGFSLGPAGGPLQNAPFIPTVVAFSVPPVTSTQLLSDVRSVIQRSESLASRDNINMLVDGRTIILRGAVSSDDERRLAEALVRLTPGVDDVVNELIVRQ